MWQKPARGILDASNTVSKLVGFVLLNVMFGGFGYLLWHRLHEKLDKVDLFAFICLVVSLSIFYGGYIFAVIVWHRRRLVRGWNYYLLWIQLVSWTVAVMVGYYIGGHPE